MTPAEDAPPTLRAVGVGYSYGRRRALQDVECCWNRGVHGVLGPNGAGKTTLIKILCGISTPHEGHLSWKGERIGRDVARSAFRERIGYLPQDPHWLGEFTLTDFLAYFAAMHGLRRAETDRAIRDVTRAVALEKERGTRLRSLSGGMRRRAFLAQAMVHDPDILVLDEPTSGLDPVQRMRVRDIVRAAAEHRVVVLTTHLVEEAMQSCDDLLVLDEGEVVWNGTPQTMSALGESVAGDPDRSGPGGPTSRAASHAELGFLSLLGETERMTAPTHPLGRVVTPAPDRGGEP